MAFYKRAFKYMARKKNKTLLLGGVFLVSLFVSLAGIIILRVTNEMLVNLAANSNAMVNVFDGDLANTISQNDVDNILKLDNIHKANRTNRQNLMFSGMLEAGLDKPIEDAVFNFTGIDDYSLDSIFSTKNAELASGTLELVDNEIIVASGFAEANGWELGTELTFQDAFGKDVKAVVAGIYNLTDTTQRETNFTIYGTPEFVNEIQEEQLYSSVSFYVADPEKIGQTKDDISNEIGEFTFNLSISDSLYQQLKLPMNQMKNLVKTMLAVIMVVSVIIVSLLLSLWMRERQKETALFLAIGISKKSIVCQRMFEAITIFAVAATLDIVANNFLIGILGSTLFSSQNIGEIESLISSQPNFSLKINDAIQVFGYGGFILLFTVMATLVPVLNTRPKTILSRID